MKNWSGNQVWKPRHIHYPEDEQAIVEFIHTARSQRQKVRVAGSLHSFTPLCHSKEVIISLERYQGLIAVDQEKNQVTVKAGTTLRSLNDILDSHGLALENMGDINAQSVAGAISTGTHGTGASFGNLSTLVTRLKIVNGHGEVVICSEQNNPLLFLAAKVSLGLLGVITEVTVQCVPAYNLELVIKRQSLEQVLNDLESINASTRNFEFYWFLNTPWLMTKYINPSTESPGKSGIKNYLQEKVLENYAFKVLCEGSYRFPGTTRRISKIAAATIDEFRKIDQSHRIFSTSRLVRFNEMEYNVPMSAYKDVIEEIRRWIDKNNRTVMFPMENRFVRGDDIWLSPAYDRDSAYIAIHMYHKKDYKAFFSAIEDIFKAYDGRPHWGKLHTLRHLELQKRYPAYDRFCEIRRTMDPDGLFMSPYMQSLFPL